MNRCPTMLITEKSNIITSTEALDQAVTIAGKLSDGIKFSDPGFMTGISGILVFVHALCERLSDDAPSPDLITLREQLISRLPDFQIEKSDEPLSLYSLASGIPGILHALYLMSCVAPVTGLEEMFNSLFARLISLDPTDSGYADIYLGTSGIILVLCELLEGSKEVSYRSVMSLRPQAVTFLRSCIGQLLDTKPWRLSGYGHGYLGLALALYRGCRLLEGEGNLSSDLKDRADRAIKEALLFEKNTFNVRLNEWPDLRPGKFPDKSLHGICSGAPGIGIGISPMTDTSYQDAQKIASLAHVSCLNAPMKDVNHLCCGNASLVEYFLTEHVNSGSPDSLWAAGHVLSYMTSLMRANGGKHPVSRFFSPDDACLFYGAAGIGYELLRYSDPLRFPAIIP